MYNHLVGLLQSNTPKANAELHSRLLRGLKLSDFGDWSTNTGNSLLQWAITYKNLGVASVLLSSHRTSINNLNYAYKNALMLAFESCRAYKLVRFRTDNQTDDADYSDAIAIAYVILNYIKNNHEMFDVMRFNWQAVDENGRNIIYYLVSTNIPSLIYNTLHMLLVHFTDDYVKLLTNNLSNHNILFLVIRDSVDGPSQFPCYDKIILLLIKPIKFNDRYSLTQLTVIRKLLFTEHTAPQFDRRHFVGYLMLIYRECSYSNPDVADKLKTIFQEILKTLQIMEEAFRDDIEQLEFLMGLSNQLPNLVNTPEELESDSDSVTVLSHRPILRATFSSSEDESDSEDEQYGTNSNVDATQNRDNGQKCQGWILI